MSIPTILYATDEDIALRASADYILLCPDDQKIAIGTDGQFFPSDPWTLVSATVDFESQGTLPNQLVQLEKPSAGPLPICEGYVVVGTGTGTVTLRRKGQLTGLGEPPSSVMGLDSVAFAISTFAPQIALVTDDINRRFGITATGYGERCVSELADPSELRDAVVLTVLFRQYLDKSRDLSGAKDTFAAKAGIIKTELDELLDRLALHWKRSTQEGDLTSPTTRFSTRMSR